MIAKPLILFGLCCVLTGGCVSEEEQPATAAPSAAAATARQKRVAAIKQRMRDDRTKLRQLQKSADGQDQDVPAVPLTPDAPTPAE
jgi:hypothetical protein